MPKSNLILALAAVRRNLWAVGETLAAEGRIDEAGDIFWLSIDEAHAGLSGSLLRELVGVAPGELRPGNAPATGPTRGALRGTEPVATGSPNAAAAAGDLSGVAASPGTVTGTVRVILDPVGAHLEPGEILVAPSTDPGWTPVRSMPPPSRRRPRLGAASHPGADQLPERG